MSESPKILILSEKVLILHQLITDVRAEYNQVHSLGLCFADHCDAVSEILMTRMQEHGFKDIDLVHGEIVHTYPDSETDRYGHTWLEWMGYIIDPTRSQFDAKESEFVIDIFDDHPYKWKH